VEQIGKKLSNLYLYTKSSSRRWRWKPLMLFKSHGSEGCSDVMSLTFDHISNTRDMCMHFRCNLTAINFSFAPCLFPQPLLPLISTSSSFDLNLFFLCSQPLLPLIFLSLRSYNSNIQLSDCMVEGNYWKWCWFQLLVHYLINALQLQKHIALSEKWIQLQMVSYVWNVKYK
jgi:hypothetical protein